MGKMVRPKKTDVFWVNMKSNTLNPIPLQHVKGRAIALIQFADKRRKGSKRDGLYAPYCEKEYLAEHSPVAPSIEEEP
jgi:hypothetical protein